jgi:hypothetical protein
MKVIYLNETIQYIASIDERKASEIVESGEVKFLIKDEDRCPYVVIENETIEDNVNDTKHT